MNQPVRPDRSTPPGYWDHVKTMEGDQVGGAPERCLITTIGNHFMPGTLESYTKAAFKTKELIGVECGLQIQHDVSIKPNEGVPTMRNWATESALEFGADWHLMVDNDFLIEDPEMLAKLICRGKPVIVPYYNQDEVHGVGHVERVQYPMLQPNQGCVPLEWISINCILFNTLVYKMIDKPLIPPGFITNKEDYVFLRLRNQGIQLWQDTDVQVKMLRKPTRVWENISQPNPNSVGDRVGVDEGISRTIGGVINELRLEPK